MTSATYAERRGQLETYFDRTAVVAWTRLTSDAPVSGIRATVRAGRDAMRATLLSWLPDDLSGARLLDAGCGTGALAVEAARRGAEVVAIDLSPTLIGLARERTPRDLAIRFEVGDMLASSLGRFDHVVAMDSLIHYRAADVVRALAGLAHRTEHSLLFTFAPRTPVLAAMHAMGKLFPRGNRSPAIEPVSPRAMLRALTSPPGLLPQEKEEKKAPALCGRGLGEDFAPARTYRVATGFYISQALELIRA